MINNSQGKEFWDLDTKEKLLFSEEAKAKGTEYFKVSGQLCKINVFLVGRFQLTIIVWP